MLAQISGVGTGKRSRDLTLEQFRERAKALGFTPEGFMGYYRFAHPSGRGATCVSVLNAGTRRRDQLAYLSAEKRGILSRICDECAEHVYEAFSHRASCSRYVPRQKKAQA